MTKIVDASILSPAAASTHGCHTAADLVAHWAHLQPQRMALMGAARSYTWSAFADAAREAAHVLRAGGVVAGDRIPIVSENSIAAVVLFVALQRIGAWPAVVNARLPQAEVGHMVACVDARLVLYVCEGSGAAQDHASHAGAHAEVMPSLGEIRVGVHNAGAVPEPAASRVGEQIACLMFTSGTTGHPKAVMLSHRGVLNMGRVVGEARGTVRDDTIHVAAPLSHAMGMSSLIPALIFGASARIVPRLDFAEMARAIADGSLTQVSMVPTGFVRLLEQIGQLGIDVSRNRLRTVVAGGAPLDPGLKARVERCLGVPMVNAYGTTECAPLARSNASGDAPPWSVGVPERTVSIRIVDGNGADVPAGENGEVWARGPSLMLGYYRNPGATAEVMREGGWYATGDLGRLLPSGELALVGRAREMIIRSGFNVYPSEVEAAINSHPAVLQSAVLGRRVADANEEVIAWVQLRPGAALTGPVHETLDRHVRAQLAPYKCPSHFHLLDALPLGATGKVLKRALATRPEGQPLAG